MEDFVRTKTHLSTAENLSTTDTQHTLTTIRNHWNKAIAGLEQLALNNETAKAQPSTENYTIHRHKMHTHCTFNTEQPEKKSNGRTRAPSPYGTTEPQHYKKNCTLQRHNTYTVLTIPSNNQTKVVVELEHLALNYGTAEPQQYKKNCTLLRDTIHTLYLR